MVLLCVEGRRRPQILRTKNVPDVWPVKKVNPQYMVHLTEKPVELAVRAMSYSSKRGENVPDLFGGSGSTKSSGYEATSSAAGPTAEIGLTRSDASQSASG